MPGAPSSFLFLVALSTAPVLEFLRQLLRTTPALCRAGIRARHGALVARGTVKRKSVRWTGIRTQRLRAGFP